MASGGLGTPTTEGIDPKLIDAAEREYAELVARCVRAEEALRRVVEALDPDDVADPVYVGEALAAARGYFHRAALAVVSPEPDEPRP